MRPGTPTRFTRRHHTLASHIPKRRRRAHIARATIGFFRLGTAACRVAVADHVSGARIGRAQSLRLFCAASMHLGPLWLIISAARAYGARTERPVPHRSAAFRVEHVFTTMRLSYEQCGLRWQRRARYRVGGLTACALAASEIVPHVLIEITVLMHLTVKKSADLAGQLHARVRPSGFLSGDSLVLFVGCVVATLKRLFWAGLRVGASHFEATGARATIDFFHLSIPYFGLRRLSIAAARACGAQLIGFFHSNMRHLGLRRLIISAARATGAQTIGFFRIDMRHFGMVARIVVRSNPTNSAPFDGRNNYRSERRPNVQRSAGRAQECVDRSV